MSTMNTSPLVISHKDPESMHVNSAKYVQLIDA